jgi:hypothetical protein
MVMPKLFKINGAQAGTTTLLIPSFAGYDLIVSRRGIGELMSSEVQILPEGGFSLIAPDQFIEDEVFTVYPYRINQTSPYWEPQQFEISGFLIGDNKIVIPEFAGLNISVSQRGVGELLTSEFSTLPEGGFQLTSGTFAEGDYFTVTPLSAIQYPSKYIGAFTRYPHKLTIWKADPSTQDSNGNWVTGWDIIKQTHCRAEPNLSVRDGLMNAGDGKVVNYSWTVYMPANGPEIGTGAKVVISNADDTEIASDTVKRFSRGQLNARAWL